jgi:uncharacterized membrane protein HdeD (DUF308 family)
MEFERLKTTWREHASEELNGASSQSPGGKLRKEAWGRFWTNLFRNEKELVIGILTAACCLIGLPLVKSLLIKAGLGITIIVVGLAFLWFSILRLAFRPASTSLPTREFLLKDRGRMDSWIRMLRWFLWVYFAFSVVSIFDYAFWVTGQRAETYMLMGYYALLVGIMQITMVRRLRRNYLRGRDALERFLHELTDKEI